MLISTKKTPFFNHVTKRGITTSKNFWTFIKSSLTNKRFLENNNITFIEENNVLASEWELAKTFNEHYINIFEKSSGIKPKDISQCGKNQNIQRTIWEIVKSYENHPSILQIKNFCSSSFHVKAKFCFHFVNEIDIKNFILYKLNRLNFQKVTGIDKIPPKLIKVAVDFLCPRLTKPINFSIELNIFHTELPYQKPILRQWWVQNWPITKNGVLPVTTFFLKTLFQFKNL